MSICQVTEHKYEESSSPVLGRKRVSVETTKMKSNGITPKVSKTSRKEMMSPTCNRKVKTVVFPFVDGRSSIFDQENVFPPYCKKLKCSAISNAKPKSPSTTHLSPGMAKKSLRAESPSSVFLNEEDSFIGAMDFGEIDSICSSVVSTPKRMLSYGDTSNTSLSRVSTSSYNLRRTPQRTNLQTQRNRCKTIHTSEGHASVDISYSYVNCSHYTNTLPSSPDLFDDSFNEKDITFSCLRENNMNCESFTDQIGDMFDKSFGPVHDLDAKNENRSCESEALSAGNSNSVFQKPVLIQKTISTVVETCSTKTEFTSSTNTSMISTAPSKNLSEVHISPESISENDSQISFASTIDSQPLIGRLQGRLKGLQSSQPTEGQTENERREKAVTAALEEAAKIHQSGTEFELGPFFGLPSLVADVLEKQRGISKLYNWQEECVKKGCCSSNLLFSLPTSGGKTLVAEILMLRQLLLKKRDVLLILPYVALVQEKVHGLSPFGVELGFLIEEYAGSRGVFPPRTGRKKHVLYVATIEKAAGLVNSLLENNRTDELGLVVADEVHMLGEGSGRGATLETTLTKLLYAAPSVQLVAMSATIGNLKELATFLKAELYTGNFRPIALKEYIKIEKDIYEVNPSARTEGELLGKRRLCSFPYSKEHLKEDPDKVGGLVGEVIPNHSCIVFCPTRKNCETLAKIICNILPVELRKYREQEKISLYRALIEEGGGVVCPTLRKTIPYGIAYHHSGLTDGERRLIEEAYLSGTLCCLCCTSTLAAGVNLPARRVIIRAPYTGAEFLTRARYKQMVGRAGRAGLDTCGESFLMVQNRDRVLVGKLLLSPMDVCHSTLAERDNHGLVSLLFTSIGLGLAISLPTLRALAAASLLAVQSQVLRIDINAKIMEIVEGLRKKGLLYIKNVATGEDMSSLPLLQKDSLTEVKSTNSSDESVTLSYESQAECEKFVLSRPVTDSDILAVSRLGRAAIKGNIDLDLASRVYNDLCAARESLAVNSHLHLMYLVIPYDIADSTKVDRIVLQKAYHNLGEEELKVAKLLYITESVIIRLSNGQSCKRVSQHVIQRFYVALMLHQLWQGKGIWEVSEMFLQHRGFTQQLLLSSSAFATCIHHFCEDLEELWAFRDLLCTFSRQLSGCSCVELLPLLDLPAVKQGRARMLYKAGFKTLHDIANAIPADLSASVEHLPYRTAALLINSAKMLLLEKAETLQGEADEVLSGLHHPTTTFPTATKALIATAAEK
ncbi:hypothetical protein SK128_001976 [Halocaridina rubra]|uniref:Helicase POLQ-like n=1 Tax=Halocaridina rubra TaxID=373956 RepID=A0AAN8XS98_HALRR